MKNEEIKYVSKETLKSLLSECTEKQQLLFKRMYSDNLELSIDDVVDQMQEDKIEWAIFQVERTVESNSFKKDETDESKKSDLQRGLYQKYIISRTDGKEIDQDNEYFILKVNGKGNKKEIEASRKALLTYSEEIKSYNPILSEDIKKKYS